MIARIGWAFAAFWLARFLFWGLPGLILDPASGIRALPFGITSASPDQHPWLGLAALLAVGIVLREKGPLLWIAAGIALCERLGGPRGFRLEWVHAAAALFIILGAWRSAMGAGALLTTALLPQVLILTLFRFRPGWQQPTLLVAVALPLVAASSFRRPLWGVAAWKWWPGFAVSLALWAASFGVSQWMDSRDRHARSAAVAALPKPDQGAPYRMDYFHKGVSFTAEGVSYDSPRARAMLANLPAFGVNAIALVPYGFSPRNETKIRIPGRSESWENEEGMELLIAEAHRLDMRVMLKPHVWRLQGRTPIPDAEARQWLAEYRPFIEHYAKFAARVRADSFCVGTELRGLTPHEKEWREIIALVRAYYKGPLVYAANHGEEFESIRFWDALDYIGIDNYYPLDDHYSAAAMVSKVETVVERFHKPVIFTEAGFGAHQNSHREPWEDETAKPLDLAEQARSYQALLDAVYRKPWFRGVYWWKVGTNGYGGPDNNSMTPWRKPAMDVVRHFYSLPIP